MRGAAIVLLVLATACGARTGLVVAGGGPHPVDAGTRDAGRAVDASPSLHDAGVPLDAGPPDDPTRDAMVPQTRHTLAAGGDFTCALDSDGHVLCWGQSGLRGWDGGTPRRCDPWGCSTTPQRVDGVSDAVDVGAGSQGEVCARTTSGAVLCWGGNVYGELGTGTTAPVETPHEVEGLTDAAEVSVDRTTCALRATGGVACWGRNDFGVVGDGTTVDRHLPVDVPGLDDVTDLAVGYDDACAVHAAGTVSCWGQADYGAIGDGAPVHARCSGSDDCALGPGTTVVGLTDVVDVAVGYQFACGRRRDGTIACWGDDHYGELASMTVPAPCRASAPALPPQPCSISPVQVVGVTDAVQIDAGHLDGCALLSTGHVVCWGDNGAGQLGDAAFHLWCAADPCSFVPVTVAGIDDATEVAVGEYHACARRASGEIDCWGDNGFGQLGDGGGHSSNTPLRVLWP